VDTINFYFNGSTDVVAVGMIVAGILIALPIALSPPPAEPNAEPPAGVELVRVPLP